MCVLQVRWCLQIVSIIFWVFFCLFSSVGYRLNKFCGEHLKVENESPEPESELPSFHQRSISHKNDIRRATNDDMVRNNNNGGPIAEALIQNEQMFHSLKILKPSPSEMEKEHHKSAQTDEKDTTDTASKRKGRIYSQVCILYYAL